MPFKSLAQERFLYAKKPELAAKWQAKYGQPGDLPKKVSNKESSYSFVKKEKK